PPTGTITGTVFNDADGDGVRDPGDVGIQGWGVWASGPAYRTATTDSNGSYSFTDVPAGLYSIGQNLQFGWERTYPASPNHSSTLDSGATVDSLDFGNFLGSGISGVKFFDADSDGLMNGEILLGGWKIYLNGSKTDSAVTGSGGGGMYTFSSLPPGTYTVTEEIRPGWTRTFPSSGSWEVVIDTPGTAVINQNFGNIAPLGSVSGTVFNDKNDNGTREPTEPGLAGWYIYLSGSEYVYTLTDSAGNYAFPDVIPGGYYLYEGTQGGWIRTVGGGNITVNPGEFLAGQDIGEFKPPNSIEAFSRLAAETGGFFAYVPEVNDGGAENLTRFRNIAYNIVQGGISKSIGLAEPSKIPVGGNVLLSVTGSNVNFQGGSPVPQVAPSLPGEVIAVGGSTGGNAIAGTTLRISGTGVTVNQVTVVSPNKLVADVTVDPGASQDFRDIIAVTDFGGGILDTSVGLGAVQIAAAPVTPTVLSITPTSAPVGDSLSVIVTGINTHYADSSVLNLGSGITVIGVTMISPTKLQATIAISGFADLGFRNVTVTTGVETANEGVPGPFLVLSEASDIALIAGISPATAVQGDSLTIGITGSNTSFDSALTGVSFSGSGIAVLAVRVISPTQVEADILVDSLAAPGYRDVFATTGTEVAAALSAFNVTVLTDIGGEEFRVPESYALMQCYPNPFNPATTIRYELPEESRVSLTVYNMLGQVVRVLTDGVEQAGYRSVVWYAGKSASGVYIYKLEAVSLSGSGRTFTQTQKMILMK
ncbi:MAG TPA: SdrD B-like domain-containing protein, partial [Bacteroidota bacterium]|nr:SdrD B-like domain-containing protein [Bacteroidota bacterium]